MIKTIIDQYEKKIPKPIHYHGNQQHYNTSSITTPSMGGAKTNITIEAVRRNAIVKNLYDTFMKSFSVGDKVTLFGNELQGDIYIIGVCKQYSELGKTEPWPENNNPMIVSLYAEDTNQTFHCTIGSITKA